MAERAGGVTPASFGSGARIGAGTGTAWCSREAVEPTETAPRRTLRTGGWHGLIVRLVFAGRRVVQAVPVVLAAAILNFLLLKLAPGDAAEVLAGEAGSATAEYMQQLRAQFGLDQPVWLQLARYVGRILALDLGFSFRHSMPVLDLILNHLQPTLLLMGTTLVVSVTLGALLGVVAALRVNRWPDTVISVGALLCYATPLFWVGLMLIVVFSVHLGWVPTSGMETVAAFHEGWERVVDIWKHLVLPATTLSLFYMALYTRLMRAAMLEQFSVEYVVTARAKGLSERHITFRHVLRNAILPVVTMAGVQTGSLLGGAVVVEAVFAWPGLGQLAFRSLFARDFNLLLGIFFISACLVVVVNLLVDLLYTLIDPRIELT
jgi:peptide/nickel transport system permease protein